jgi:hypothetical protein
VLIKPVGELVDVPKHRQPTVLAATMHHDPHVALLFGRSVAKPLGLFERC